MKNSGLIHSAFYVVVILSFLSACHSKSGHDDISTDSVAIAQGQLIFTQQCSACHNFRQDGIGPQLGGVTHTASADWLRKFIKDPKAVVDSGDEQAKNLIAHFKTLMPSFAHFSEEQLTQIIAYLNTKAAPNLDTTLNGQPPITNPLPDPIAQSNLVVDVDYVAEIPASAKEGGFKTRITKLDYIPGSQRLFIVDIRGKLYALTNNTPRVYMDMATLKPNFIDQPGLATGFGSFAFHPEFLKNGLLYTSHTEAPGSAKADFHYADSIPTTVQWVVTEWKTEQPSAATFKGTSRELFRVNMVTGMHGMQELTFNPNSKPGAADYGLLYIGLGDGGCVESGFPFLVQNMANPWGSILRIDPQGNNSANKNYGIPAGNPFANDKHALGEVYAYGFRNPHRITWTQAGQMLASNVGQANIESVNLIEPGHNYGWPIREGTFVQNPNSDLKKVYALPANDSTYHITYPAAQYDHDEGLAISGGFEYTGNAIPQLRGKYFFADMNYGRLYYVDLADVKPGQQAAIKEWNITFHGKPTTTAELHGSKRVDLRFGKDSKGDVYFFSKQDGKVYKLAHVNAAISGI